MPNEVVGQTIGPIHVEHGLCGSLPSKRIEPDKSWLMKSNSRVECGGSRAARQKDVRTSADAEPIDIRIELARAHRSRELLGLDYAAAVRIEDEPFRRGRRVDHPDNRGRSPLPQCADDAYRAPIRRHAYAKTPDGVVTDRD